MRLRNKINLYTTVLFAVLLIVMNVSVYFTFSKLIMNSELLTANEEIKKVTSSMGKSLGTISEADLTRSFVPINGMIQIVMPDNRQFHTVTSSTEKTLSRRRSKFYKGEVNKIIQYRNKTYTFESMPHILEDGRVSNLQITKSVQTAIDNLKILRLVLISVTLLALIPVFISSRILSRLITLPVTSMINTMTEIRKNGRFKRLELEEKSKDELNQMGETFNHMIDLLEENFRKQEEFVSNASHELKTPLTIIESYASLLKRRGLIEPSLFAESIEAIHSESIRMKEMVGQLLLLAKHHEHWNIDFKPVNLNDFLEQTVKSFENGYGRDINLHQAANLMVETDERKLKQLIFIFLDNARKYSDTIISIVTGVENGKVFIKIIDQGIGIPKDELPKVFGRFYRVDKARSRKQGGTGLGLSIAKEIADAIGITIQIDSEEGVGTTAILYLKIDNS